jgi:hypothetical protein
LPYTEATSFPEPLRRDLGTTSEKRARLIGELIWRNPAMADLLIQLEADDVLRPCLEAELMQGAYDARP